MNIPFAFLLALASKRAFPTRYTKGCGRKIAALFLIADFRGFLDFADERRKNTRSAVYLTIWNGFFYQYQVVFLCLKNIYLYKKQ